jgi:hypothetical protein
MKRRIILLIVVGIAGVLYGLQPPSWELTGDIPVALTAYDVVETPSGALLAAIAEWTSGSHALVYRSTDGGDTWTGTLFPVLVGGSCWDLELNASGRVYASANLSNGVEQRLYYSDDDGVTWAQLTMRIPLNEIYRGANSTAYYPVGLKCHDDKLYVFGRSKGTSQGPLFHGEVWIYDEIGLTWSKWDLVDLNADEGGWTIETGPGPGAGTYLYLGTYNTGTVIRSTNPLAATSSEKNPRRSTR